MRAAPIAVPPAAEQKEIARRLVDAFAAIEALTGRIERATIRANDVERAALAKAFRGELVPQDPNDEPAAALVERASNDATEQAPDKFSGRASRPRTQRTETRMASGRRP